MKSTLGCQVTILPMKYLGLPYGAAFKVKSTWDPIIDCMQQRLTGYCICQKGPLTLFISTFSSLTTYFTSLLSHPKGVPN